MLDRKSFFTGPLWLEPASMKHAVLTLKPQWVQVRLLCSRCWCEWHLFCIDAFNHHDSVAGKTKGCMSRMDELVSSGHDCSWGFCSVLHNHHKSIRYHNSLPFFSYTELMKSKKRGREGKGRERKGRERRKRKEKSKENTHTHREKRY